VAFSPDSNTLASAGQDKTVKLWDADTGRAQATLKGHTNWVSSVAFSPDGKTLASGSGDGALKLWNMATVKERLYSRTVEERRRDLQGDGSIPGWVWDKHAAATIQGDGSIIFAVAFSPAGKHVATGNGVWDQHEKGHVRGTVKLWDTLDRREALIISDPELRFSAPYNLRFSFDGKRLAAGLSDGRVMLVGRP
jgi:WD40 repeat protein